jgi:hypothetical protein
VSWVAVPQQDMAFHLISAHCDPLAIARPHAGNTEQHHHEHTGPGTIRNHPVDSRAWDPVKLEQVLEEAEEMG